MPSVARKHPSKLRLLIFAILPIIVLFTGLIAVRSLFPLEYQEDIRKWSRVYNLEPAWVASVIRCESNFHEKVISPAGAIGLMQIMPTTGVWIAEQLEYDNPSDLDLQNASTNIALGTWYLRNLLDRFHTADVALMAYNAGPSRAETWLATSADPFLETSAYIKRVHRFLPIYRVLIRASWLYKIAPDLRI
jgi:peptidoglycan lytic transglycosylase